MSPGRTQTGVVLWPFPGIWKSAEECRCWGRGRGRISGERGPEGSRSQQSNSREGGVRGTELGCAGGVPGAVPGGEYKGAHRRLQAVSIWVGWGGVG